MRNEKSEMDNFFSLKHEHEPVSQTEMSVLRCVKVFAKREWLQ